MNNKKKSIFQYVGVAAILLLDSMHLGYSADQSDSAQQALQQLRLLQQKLSQTGTQFQPGQPTQGQGAQPTQGQGAQPTQGQATQQQTGTTTPPNQPAGPQTQAPQVQGPQAQTQQDNTPSTPEADNELIDSQAFEGVTRQLFPLTPEQIVRLKQIYNSSEYAQAATAGTPPKPTATSQFVNLSPGSTPPVIRLSQGFVSSLVFLDSTGSPWPISAYDLGDPASFNIQWDKSGNTLMIQSLKLYTYGNLAVRLRGLNTPVMLTLIPGQKAVDYRVDLRVQGIGPNAKAIPMEEGIPPSANDILLHVLDGVPPPGSQRLTVSGGDARAWLLDEKMYVRTNLTILSPGWIASMTSADGMRAYEMQKSPVLLVSWHGKVMQLKVEGL
ncbi:DotH/IcmK family type IV secretion protein [Legionella brunensis]|uniref:IcmK protein n=1 Tax=Legionella brunensis TaxID=29422 RepID=A0A0W0SSV3_9GAMM|nr:IcmK protein [Legionella brunensis]